jgi:UBX domain-containing protein 1
MFRTLDDLKKEQKDTKKKDKKTTESYTGGEKSGMAVENPEDIQGILKKAKENSKAAKERGLNSGPEEEHASNCKITLYRNGFTVDEGEFRSYNDPANKKFMAELNKGTVPEELRSKYPQGLRVGLEDRKKEEYELPPPPKYTAFSGKGTSLGGAPAITNTTTTPAVINTKAEPPKVNSSKPKTRVMIRLHTGKTEEIEVNLSTRVSEIFNYVWSLAPVTGEFDLMAGFPPQPLKDMNQTVEEAGLEDSKVTQRIL